MTFFPSATNVKAKPKVRPSSQYPHSSQNQSNLNLSNTRQTRSQHDGAILFDARPQTEGYDRRRLARKVGMFGRWIENLKRSVTSPWAIPTFAAIVVRLGVNVCE